MVYIKRFSYQIYKNVRMWSGRQTFCICEAAAGGRPPPPDLWLFFDTRHSQRIPVNCTYERGKKVNEKTLEMRMERKTELKKRTAFCFAFWRKMYGTESEVLVQFRRRRRRFISKFKKKRNS